VDPRPDQTRARRRHVPRQDALRPLATLREGRTYHRHAPELHAGARSQYLEYTLPDNRLTSVVRGQGATNTAGPSTFLAAVSAYINYRVPQGFHKGFFLYVSRILGKACTMPSY
jgi:hypothetical protein